MRGLGSLAPGISHDFNNFLPVGRRSNDLLRRGTGANPELQEEVEPIETPIKPGKNHDARWRSVASGAITEAM